MKTLLASVDVIMTKPGYSTIVEAVTLQQPVVYVRRYNFADEAPLVDYLQRYGRGIELSLDDFTQGRWGQLSNKPWPHQRLRGNLLQPEQQKQPPSLLATVRSNDKATRRAHRISLNQACPKPETQILLPVLSGGCYIYSYDERPTEQG